MPSFGDLRRQETNRDPLHNSKVVGTLYTMECQICGEKYQAKDDLEPCPNYDTHEATIEMKRRRNYALFDLPLFETAKNLNKKAAKVRIQGFTEKGIRLDVVWNREGDMASVWMPRRYVEVSFDEPCKELLSEHVGQEAIIFLRNEWAQDLLDKKVRESLGAEAERRCILREDAWSKSQWWEEIS